MSAQQLTVGVLGHVDHGKTSLVKALTGADTDRLEEEKRRGMSIVLGFAYLENESGTVDFIDVPGHEDFIRTMISGATGIDAVLLVVAADEGVKPQTLEHFAIARLLGIKQGLIVVNKSDLADQSLLGIAHEELKQTVAGTFLESAPIFNVSSVSGDGIPELSHALSDMVSKRKLRASAESFYLPMDRVFTIDGFGTVGTGTLRNGVIACEDEVEIMPNGLTATIREIQVHNQKVNKATPGQRVAVNLRGIKREQLDRGNILIKPGSIKETTCLHAKLHVLDDLSRLPKRNEPIRVLFGTENVLAKLRVVEDKPLQSGASLLVQLRCREPVIVSTGEHFIVRTCSPAVTFGGGEFLDTSESLLQMNISDLQAHLQTLEFAGTAGKIIAHVKAAGHQGVSLVSLSERAVASQEEVFKALIEDKTVIVDESIAVDQRVFDQLSQRLLQELEDFHKDNASAGGQGLDVIRAQFSDLCSVEITEHIIQHLLGDNAIAVEGNIIRLQGFSKEDSFSEQDRALMDSIEHIYRSSGAVTPSVDEVVGNDPEKKRAFQYLKESKNLISIRDHVTKKLLVFHLDTINDIKRQLSETYPPPSQFTVSDFRKLTGSSRKYVIPLLEYFDRNRITIRAGDYRTLVRSV
jgi:selenocysteine-specific elongation factor